jgi:signal transduction histidine kinase
MARKDADRAALRDANWRMILRLEASVSVAIGLLMLIIWALAGAGNFWPAWVWLGLAIPLAFQVAIRRGRQAPKGHRLLTVHGAITCVLASILLAIWFLAGAGPFWPVWPILGLSVVLVSHAWIRHALPTAREHALADRVEVLTRTRRGALDVQAAELQRIERDLHDGAQARLAALGLSIGLAEQLVHERPDEAVQILAEARSSSDEALADLRSLVRGILPPVLAERGLEGAVLALAAVLPLAVEVRFEPGIALSGPAESALYFALAEALANVAKHSGARRAVVRVSRAGAGRAARIEARVEDDGVGGADPAAGGGLRGMERRLAAFDGVVAVASPAGGPTVVRMEVPCGY